MPEFLRLCLIVCPLVFLAGFVDSIAGGGGLLSLPAYLLAGLPTHIAAGTNKCVNCVGTAVATGKYLRGGKVQLALALPAGGMALVGSAIGTRLALLLDAAALKLVILCALPLVAVFLLVKKDFGQAEGETTAASGKNLAVSGAVGLVMGCYDGLVGPGTGTFLIMLFTALLHMDLLSASANAKVANLASNAASAVVWLLNGQVMLTLALPAMACNVLGNYLGARSALKGGVRQVRRVLFAVLALLLVKLGYDLLAG